MKKIFCANCGKETEELVEGICKKCFRERNTPCEIPEEVELIFCKDCGRFRIGGEWVDTDLEKAGEERIKEELNVKEGVKNFEIEIKGSPEREGKEIVAEGERENVEIKEVGTVDIELKETTCDRCSKISSGYFEAVVQIRGPDEKVEDALKVARKVLENSRNKKAFVSDLKGVKNGINLSVGSKSVAKKIVKKISSHHKTERKNTKTLYGEEEGQRKYRSTYLVRILE